jgi:hypothetical protein
MVSETTPKLSPKYHTTALDQAALQKALDPLKG